MVAYGKDAKLKVERSEDVKAWEWSVSDRE
jgi:hypothetical protein